MKYYLEDGKPKSHFAQDAEVTRCEHCGNYGLNLLPCKGRCEMWWPRAFFPREEEEGFAPYIEGYCPMCHDGQHAAGGIPEHEFIGSDKDHFCVVCGLVYDSGIHPLEENDE